jgi:hypothetical protein
MRTRFIFVVAVACLAACLPAGAGVMQQDIASIHGDLSRSLLGDGRGVTVAVVDGGVDSFHPALNGSQLVAKDFSKSKTTDDDRTDEGHGTGIAGILVGHDYVNGYVGLAPGATYVNARVVNSADYTNDNLVGNGIFYAVNKGARVINLSLGEVDPNPNQNKLNLIADFVAEKYGAVIVAAAGNENASASGGAPNAQYNGFTVGATGGPYYDHVTDFSNYALDTDLRSKPDIVAPGEGVSIPVANWETGTAYTSEALGTSFAAPMVGGIAAQMMGYGKAHHLSTDPLVIKAVMLAGTSKVSHFDGSPWSPRDQVDTAAGSVIDEPLDDEEGAGRVDGYGAYSIYAKQKSKSQPIATWKLASMKENGSFTLKLGTLKPGQHVDAALTWLRHVARTGNGDSDGLDASDKFTQSATLAEFSLTLLAKSNRVAVSQSTWDNLDYLSIDIPRKGAYSLLITRLPGSGLASEDYALAARVTAGGIASPALLRSARAQAVYTATGASRSFDPEAIEQVPEPTNAVLVFGLGCVLMKRLRRAGAR